MANCWPDPQEQKFKLTHRPQMADWHRKSHSERNRSTQVRSLTVSRGEHREEKNERDEKLYSERLVVLQCFIGDGGSKGAP